MEPGHHFASAKKGHGGMCLRPPIIRLTNLWPCNAVPGGYGILLKCVRKIHKNISCAENMFGSRPDFASKFHNKFPTAPRTPVYIALQCEGDDPLPHPTDHPCQRCDPVSVNIFQNLRPCHDASRDPVPCLIVTLCYTVWWRKRNTVAVCLQGVSGWWLSWTFSWSPARYSNGRRSKRLFVHHRLTDTVLFPSNRVAYNI